MGKKVKIGKENVYYNELIYLFYYSFIFWFVVIKVIFLFLYVKNIFLENFLKDFCSYILSDFY